MAAMGVDSARSYNTLKAKLYNEVNTAYDEKTKHITQIIISQQDYSAVHVPLDLLSSSYIWHPLVKNSFYPQ